jgi:carbon-monoxide dehydrogenase large subunit
MNIHAVSSENAFGVGQSVKRIEDATLVRGRGCYTDDVSLSGQVYAYFARSTIAHGVIKSIDTAAARAMPGVRAVLTASDVAEIGIGGIRAWIPPGTRHKDGSLLDAPVRPPLATDRVRCAGEPIALIVADTLLQAKDAAEAVAIEIDPLPAVASVGEAMRSGAAAVHAGAPNNVAWDFVSGDVAAVEQAFARASHVTRLPLRQNRVVPSTMEPRSAIASYDSAHDKWTLHVVSQGVLRHRAMLAQEVLDVPQERVQVITGNVGGSFGLKGALFVEYPAIMAAARLLGRPVKWTDERSGSFLSDNHSRTHDGVGELALDADGRMLAVRFDGTYDAGAYVVMCGPVLNAARHMVSVYDVPHAAFAMRMVYTNTVPVAALRGAGRPEGAYFMERLIDTAAAELGLAPAELRRRNLIKPKQMPYRNAVGVTYDSGDFPAVLKAALAAADAAGFAARRRQSRREGKLRGLGIGMFVEISGPGGGELGGLHFDAEGVTIVTGTHDHGQGHGAPLAQILVDRLGLPFEAIKLHQRDSDEIQVGGATGGSRSAVSSGSALVEACARVIERGHAAAAHFLEAAEADIEFAEGRFRVAGTDRGIALLDLASRLRDAVNLPDGMPRTLDIHEVAAGDYPSTYPNGCHVAEIEIDDATNETRLVKYTSVDDCGVLLNPMIVEGQIQGGVMMGAGQALMEHAVFDDAGQLLTGSFMDYAMPRAEDAPPFECISHPVPTATNPLGIKGCGEAGVSGALAAIMNAVNDALRPLGAAAVDMPATAPRIWQAIRDVR